MNKILLAAIAVLVVAGAFLLIGNKQSAPTTQTQPSVTQGTVQTQKIQVPTQGPNTTITITKAGFEPKVLTIKVGTRVIWKNTSGGTVTVNSDPHPTHALFPFLNLGAFDNGSSVQAVFEKAGTYAYHNHLDSSQKGTVIVE